eukprot:365852-Chlamydomonas_euryale.AAC.8
MARCQRQAPAGAPASFRPRCRTRLRGATRTEAATPTWSTCASRSARASLRCGSGAGGGGLHATGWRQDARGWGGACSALPAQRGPA